MNEKVTIVELKDPASLEIVRRIADDVWPKTFREILSPEQIVYMMKMMYAPEVMEKELAAGVHFRAAFVDGTAAGYTSWAPYTIPGTAKLHKVYLLQTFQGRGIGSAMLADASEQARKAGFTRLRLNVNKHNERARRAYFRNGFVDVESVKIDIGHGFFMDDFVMEKLL